MIRRGFAALLLLLPIAAVQAAEPPRPPNIVLIVADDLGGRDLGCYGSGKSNRPVLISSDNPRFRSRTRA